MSVVLRCKGRAPHHTKSVYRWGGQGQSPPWTFKEGGVAPPLISELSHFSNLKLKR